MTLNFLLREMTHLRYYIPIIQEGNRRGVKSKICLMSSGKYNCPTKHTGVCEKVMKEYDIDQHTGDLTGLSGVFFANETSGLDVTKRIADIGNNKVVITTYQTDFIECYPKYKDIADYIMMPSKNIAKYYGYEDDKNLYVGIPKYDIELDKEAINEKHNLDPDKKKVLMMWPKSRDLSKFPIDIVKNFTDLGWQVLVKSRAKDPISDKTKKSLLENGHQYFYDGWYPHTSQELLEVSDLVVNCGSTTIEECVMHEVPLINFDIKPQVRHGIKQKYRVTHEYLYDYGFCINLTGLDRSFNTAALDTMIQHLFQKDLKSEFKRCKQDWLYDHKNTCKSLLDVLLS